MAPQENKSHLLSIWWILLRCLHTTSFDFFGHFLEEELHNCKMHPGMRGSRLASWCKWFTHRMTIAFDSMGPNQEQNGKMYDFLFNMFSISFCHVPWLSSTPCACMTCPMQLSTFVKSQACRGTSLLTWKPAQSDIQIPGNPRIVHYWYGLRLGMSGKCSPGLTKYEENLKPQLQQPTPAKLLRSSKPTIPLQ